MAATLGLLAAARSAHHVVPPRLLSRHGCLELKRPEQHGCRQAGAGGGLALSGGSGGGNATPAAAGGATPRHLPCLPAAVMSPHRGCASARGGAGEPGPAGAHCPGVCSAAGRPGGAASPWGPGAGAPPSRGRFTAVGQPLRAWGAPAAAAARWVGRGGQQQGRGGRDERSPPFGLPPRRRAAERGRRSGRCRLQREREGLPGLSQPASSTMMCNTGCEQVVTKASGSAMLPSWLAACSPARHTSVPAACVSEQVCFYRNVPIEQQRRHRLAPRQLLSTRHRSWRASPSSSWT